MSSDRVLRFVGYLFITLVILLTLFPFALLVIVSFSSEASIATTGYSLFPSSFSLAAYEYLYAQASQIINAYGITIFVTVVGTFFNVLMSVMFAYPLSRRDYPLHKAQMYFLLVTMMFNGGLVPTYLMYTNIFHIRDSLIAYLVPSLLMNAFNIILLRTYFVTNLPEELLEAARIDGAGEFRIFFRIVLPLSKPIIATVGLFAGIAYWNDWINGLYYVQDAKCFSLQVLLNHILTNAQFMQSSAAQSSGQVAIAMQGATLPLTTMRLAIAVISIVPLMIVFLSLQKYYTKGIAIGSLKG